MHCNQCQQPLEIKERYAARTCPCDEEERIIPFDVLYQKLFNIPISDIVGAPTQHRKHSPTLSSKRSFVKRLF